MREFRFHGRGGQGVVILGKLVSRLFFQQGCHVKEFPKFGVERRGAPVEGYVRVDDVPIDLSCQVYEPNAVVVMAETIIDAVDVTAGLKPGSWILVNTAKEPATLADRLPGFRVATVDANAIALQHGLGTAMAPIANTTLFGAVAKLLDAGADELDGAVAALIKRPSANIAAAHDAYAAVSAPELLPGEVIVHPPRPLPFQTFEQLPEHAYSVRDARINRTGAWRSQRPEFRFKTAPCNALCPAGNDVRGFLQAIARGDAPAALARLLETSPLPAVCGRVCPHPCESECNREPLEGPVSIRALERHAATHGGEIEVQVAPATGRRVAIVGSGPAGLSAAWQLAKLGHRVTIYEAAPEPGGMLVLGIPEFRLPRAELQRDLDRITKLGVELRCSSPVDGPAALTALCEEHDAVLLAVGQMVASGLRAPGVELPGVQQGLEFLRRHNLGEPVEVRNRVVVIGGGNTAVDVAGVALRRSATGDVTILYRRSRDQMPAIAEEVEQVIAEGAKLVELIAPVEVLAGADGRAAKLVCERMRLGAPDASGRPRPEPIPDSRHTIECDQIILATGQWTDLEFAGELTISADSPNTDRSGLFICGDANTGAGTVTAAIGSGREAALAIHAQLGGELPVGTTSWAPRSDEVLRYDRINPAYFAPRPRAEAPRLPEQDRLAGFEEVIGELPDGQAEATRCLSCGTCTGCDNCALFCPEPAVHRADGVYSFDLGFCKGCGICMQECPRGVIDMEADL